jgi:hypothetical protein
MKIPLSREGERGGWVPCWGRSNAVRLSDLVDNEHVDAQQALLQSGELARIPGFQELTDKIRRSRKQDTACLLCRLDAHGDRQVLSGPAAPFGHSRVPPARD